MLQDATVGGGHPFFFLKYVNSVLRGKYPRAIGGFEDHLCYFYWPVIRDGFGKIVAIRHKKGRAITDPA
jgi:hypothetical protein